MEGKTSTTQTPARQAGRFILLVQASEPRPARLLEGLRKRGALVRVVHDAAAAMVEIARFKAQVIIIHQAERVTALESLLAAIRLYHPSTICWRHEPAKGGERERLLPFACEVNYAPKQTDASAAATSQPHASGKLSNGHHANGNGNGHAALSSAMAPSELAKRLATRWSEGADDLTAGPLLSPEEIELLRGPADSNDFGFRSV